LHDPATYVSAPLDSFVFAVSELRVRGIFRDAGAIHVVDRRFEYRSERGIPGNNWTGRNADNFGHLDALPQ
jgi:hypothetical protein